MSCPECGGEQLAIPVPVDLREYLRGDTPGVFVCRSCLAMRPADDPPAELPDLGSLDDALPSNPEAALPLVLLVGLLDSLAVNRSEITALLERAERAGTDPLLVVDRLGDSFGADAHVDLASRRRQLEQLL
jgi:hypothetical protein